jgi:general secretion pathway protein L
MLRAFLAWWGQQLFSLLPERIAWADSTGADAVLIFPLGSFGGDTAEGVEVLVRRRGQISRMGQYGLDGSGLANLKQGLGAAGLPTRIIVQLPAGVLLDKQLVLPLAAERDLDRVLRYEMDTETPFTVEEVYWDWTIEARDRAQGRLVLRLFLLPRVRLAGLLAILGQAGVSPFGIEAPRSQGAPLLLPLADETRHAARPERLRLRVAQAVCLGLVFLAAGLPFIRQQIALSAVEARIAAAEPAANEALAVRAQLDGSAGGGDVIRAERARRPDPLKALAALTDALPDDTYLTDFVLKEGRLSISGQSAAATRLIGAIAASAEFREPSFAAPVTRIGLDSNKLDQFTIAAEVRHQP